MTTIWPAVVAVAGTILGVAVTQVTQTRTSRRNERFQQREALWREQVAAFRSLAENLQRLRRAQHDRWESEHEHGRHSEASQPARGAEVQRRPEAWAALAHVELLVDDTALVDHCRETYRLVRNVHSTKSEEERAAADQGARDGIDQMLRMSAEYLRRGRG